jgi:hypothetical protein
VIVFQSVSFTVVVVVPVAIVVVVVWPLLTDEAATDIFGLAKQKEVGLFAEIQTLLVKLFWVVIYLFVIGFCAFPKEWSLLVVT